MFRHDADLQKLAESRSQVDLDAAADDAFSMSDDDEKKYEAFEAGFDLGKSAGTKDVWEVLIAPDDDSLKTSYFFIGTKEEVIGKLKKLPVSSEEIDKEVEADKELEEAKEMEGA